MKEFIQGIRPKTLIAGALPPIISYSVSLNIEAENKILYFTLCLLLALFIQIATNFYNDAIDFKKGADEKRVGPKRITGEASQGYKKVMLIGHFFIILSLVVGIPLMIKGGITFTILGFLSLFLAYGYTGGPFPLAYLGLGELFVILFFGFLATVGSFYLISSTINIYIFIVGFKLGLLSSVLIAINNYRDRHTDVKVGKRTLATRMSDRAYLNMIDVFLFLPYLIVIIETIFFDIKAFFPIFAITIAYKIRNDLRNLTDLSKCNECLAMSGKHLLVFGLLFMIRHIWS